MAGSGDLGVGLRHRCRRALKLRMLLAISTLGCLGAVLSQASSRPNGKESFSGPLTPTRGSPALAILWFDRGIREESDRCTRHESPFQSAPSVSPGRFGGGLHRTLNEIQKYELAIASTSLVTRRETVSGFPPVKDSLEPFHKGAISLKLADQHDCRLHGENNSALFRRRRDICPIRRRIDKRGGTVARPVALITRMLGYRRWFPSPRCHFLNHRRHGGRRQDHSGSAGWPSGFDKLISPSCLAYPASRSFGLRLALADRCWIRRSDLPGPLNPSLS